MPEDYTTNEQTILEIIDAINACWLEGRSSDLTDYLHPEIVMALPGFSGSIQGSDQMVAGFQEMVETATTRTFDTSNSQASIVGHTAVASYTFSMEYERGGQLFSSTGTDLWVFQRDGSQWKAVWRTMLDMEEEEIG